MRSKGGTRRQLRTDATRASRAVDEAGLRPQPSVTAMAGDVLRAGALPGRVNQRDEMRRAAHAICVGDPDDLFLANEYVGEETPGGTTPTPDQNSVDDIGRAYGLQEEDSGALRSAFEVLRRRDRQRFELRPPRKP